MILSSFVGCNYRVDKIYKNSPVCSFALVLILNEPSHVLLFLDFHPHVK